MLEIRYPVLLRIASRFIYKYGQKIREPDELVKDLAQAAALALIQLPNADVRRVRFATMTAMGDEFSRWVAGVSANQRKRELNIPVDFEKVDIVDNRTPEATAMASECISKMVLGDIGPLPSRFNPKFDIPAMRAEVCKALLDSGASYILTIPGSLSPKTVNKTRKLVHKLIQESIEVN